ncbi:MAG: LysE family transporter [Thermoguttaceae bacterium]|nr:LysE family transporter [Thermoguttaceae bacterium]
MDFTTSVFGALAFGASMGVQGAVSTGPLQNIIVTESLSNGFRSSWRAAFAPVLSDPVVIFLALTAFSFATNTFLGVVAFVGAIWLLRIAYDGVRTTEANFEFETAKPTPMWKILATNFTNPNLWIFSTSVNALNARNYANEVGIWASVVYLASFWGSIVLCNLAIAFVVAKSRGKLNKTALKWICRALGVAMAVIAVWFFYIGFVYFSAK